MPLRGSRRLFGSDQGFPGKIVAPYSLPLILTAYVSFYLTILWDLFVDDAQVSISNLTAGAALVIISVIGCNWSISALGSYHSITMARDGKRQQGLL